ncbi:hypothetical protein PG996_013917 [Apiospora saccharicola]|uniref:C2H2 type master regulator of conidiophore development brlA n=1 Tax=Apiospora saccharicola TaxID=335842 RepID=A0ABR1TGT7_9PEZI
MATLILSGNHISGSGSNPAANRTFQCAVCNKTLGSGKSLQQHVLTHDKKFRCDFNNCGAEFTRGFQLARHKYAKHGQNTTIHVCHMNDCNRSGLALASFRALRTHLRKYHQGATMEDNKQAAVESRASQTGESSNEEEVDSDNDFTMADESDNVTTTEEARDPSDDGLNDADLDDADLDDQDRAKDNDHENSTLAYYKYRVQVLEGRISEAEDRLAKNDLKHVLEIQKIHSFY